MYHSTTTQRPAWGNRAGGAGIGAGSSVAKVSRTANLQCRAEAPRGATTSSATRPVTAASQPPAAGAKDAQPNGPPRQVTIDQAMAAKINAARELARRLAEEKAMAAAAAAQQQKDGAPAAGAAGAAAGTPAGRAPPANPVDVANLKRAAEEASAAAAANAARADALSRALRRAEGSKDQLTALKAENDALRELVQELAGDKDAARKRLEQVLARFQTNRKPSAAPSSTATDSSTDTQAGAAGTDKQAPELEAKLVAASEMVAQSMAGEATAQVPLDGPAPDMDVEVQQVKAKLATSAGGVTTEPSEQVVKQVVKQVERSAAAAGAGQACSGGGVSEATGAPKPSSVSTDLVDALIGAGDQAAPAPKSAAEVALQVLSQSEMATVVLPADVQSEAESALEDALVLQESVARAQAAAAAATVAAQYVELAPPSVSDLQRLASTAAREGRTWFTWPAEGIPLGVANARLYYNRAKGPLPPTGRLQLKAGFNKWERIELFDMQRAGEMQSTGSADWWWVGLKLSMETFKVDYVVQDRGSAAVDNNLARDYVLPLVDAPTEEELMERILAQYTAFDEARRKMLEDEERRLWRTVEASALDAAAAARLEFRRRRDAELVAAATQVVAERRKPSITAVPAAQAVPGVYAWLEPPRPGMRCRLAYNLGVGPLSGGGMPAGALLHLGYDGWWNQYMQVVEFAPLSPDELGQHQALLVGPSGSTRQVVVQQQQQAQWAAALVEVPYSAAVLNWVVSDKAKVNWDNNAGRDYHTLVVEAQSGDQLVEMLAGAMRRDSADADKALEDRAALRAVRRVEAKGMVMRKRREAMHEFLYTKPLTPRAGQAIEVYYRPEATMLRGRPEIWLFASWNRKPWRPGQGGLQVKMEPTIPGASIGFHKATLQVPADAGGLDLSFSDSANPASDAFIDDNGGLDYHIPVDNTGVRKQGLNVVHVSVEMAPIAKVGGMGDVVTALGRAVQEQGHNVRAVLPKYDCLDYSQVEDLVQDGGFPWGGTYIKVWRGIVEGLETIFLEPENGMFWVGCIYGRNNDAQRFGFFCGAALEFLRHKGPRPDVLHCHDWPTAAAAFAGGLPHNCKVVFTIHNLSYGADLIGRAMSSCHVATTVSPTYAREISGHPTVAPHLNKMYGVLNGIDVDIWDPSEDPHLPMHYSADNVSQGKAEARRQLRERLALSNMDVPIVGCVTRLVAQKGIHLIKHAAWRTMERGGQFVLLGSAPDGRVQAEFNQLRNALASQYPGRAALIFTYDEPLSHLIYAGSDMFLVPSMFEPCGLTQMIAMRYGTVPVVRKTGGLVDTVFDVDHDEERALAKGMETNGFSFEGTDSAGLDYALNRALSVWYSNRPFWQDLRRRIMTQDWSWNSAALDYIELYYKALKA